MDAPGGGEVQGSFSAVAGRDADPALSIQVEPSVRRYATQSSPASIGTPGTRSGMKRWKGQPRRCSLTESSRFQRSQTRTAADADTPVQTQEETVTRDTPEVAVTAAPDRAPQLRTSDQAGDSPAIAEDIARRVVAEERVRIASIYDAARKLAIETGIADDLVRRGITLDEARTVLIDRAAERDRAVETRPHIRTGGLDEREVRRGAVETALLHRFDPHRYAISESGRDWRGYSLIEMARSFLEAEGGRVRGLSRDEIATRALHTTSDFPAILAAVTNKTLRDAYEAAPRTFPPLARRATAADFKDMHRLQLGEAPQLEKVNEFGRVQARQHG